MSSVPACCICSSVLDTIDSKTEKPVIAARHLSCCSRPVCQRCIAKNPRYNSYCPYCQISTDPQSTLPQGLRDPPPYNDSQDSTLPPLSEKEHDAPPAYFAQESSQPPPEKTRENAPDVLHFLTPADTALSLSLAYGVPLPALRKANNVFADHLIQGRRTVIIPGEYYQGVSLSPRPVEGEEEELRKSKLRRFMVTCKVSEYDVAQLYLEQHDYDLDSAVEAYQDDEKWEKEHPLQDNGKGKMSARTVGKRRYVGSA
ncbi:hypothetical protein E4T50_00969 [Aureobasidium sp. EXF-12298]|nr:hypothetical protein E4T50_00969 [Aureobasidium sp. EXF-12298]KAI4766433.1 hypothetical protein E4T51_00613 [Aureobasidium sp. EXF-12344]KAI4783863.1 hypothetical protein E4T52_01148 [Aureobasidium sp. EXF-3400]